MENPFNSILSQWVEIFKAEIFFIKIVTKQVFLAVNLLKW